MDNTTGDAVIFTDEARAYCGLDRKHIAVKHSAGEYVKGMAHTNGIESFLALLKRGYYDTHHWMSEKHLRRYINEFSECHGLRDSDTLRAMGEIATRMTGKKLNYCKLTN